MIRLTPIKPKTTAAMLRRMEQVIKAQTQQSAKELVADYEKTYQTWEHRPTPTVTVSRQGVSVRIDDPIWNFVNQGTRPHEIRAKRGRALAFASGYTAKTRPGSIIAKGGGPHGATAFAQVVQHPGTKARGFTRRLKAKWQAKWPKDMQAAISKAVR